MPPDLDLLYGGARMLAWLPKTVQLSIPSAMVTFGSLFILRLLLKRPTLAMIATMMLITLGGLGGENFALETPGAILFSVTAGLCAGRVGLLGVVALWIYQGALSRLPLPIAPGVSYATSTIIVLAALGLVAVYAFRTSLGSRPLFSRAIDEDLAA